MQLVNIYLRRTILNDYLARKKRNGSNEKKRATTYAGVAAPFIARLLDFGGCDRNHKTNIGKKIAKRNERNTRCGVKT